MRQALFSALASQQGINHRRSCLHSAYILVLEDRKQKQSSPGGFRYCRYHKENGRQDVRGGVRGGTHSAEVPGKPPWRGTEVMKTKAGKERRKKRRKNK